MLTKLFTEYNFVLGVLSLAGILYLSLSWRKASHLKDKLVEENTYLAHAIEQCPVLIVITDRQGNIKYVNPFFCQITGYSASEVLGKNPRILKSGDQPVEFYKKMWATILQGKEWTGEFHNRKKNGELYWETASISAVRSQRIKKAELESSKSSHDITAFIAVKQDVTELKKMEESLRKALAVKSDFVSTVSHELRTPLTVLKEGVSLILTEHFGPLNDRQKEYLAMMERNANTLSQLINGVLDLQKIESGAVELLIEEHDMNALVKQGIQDVSVLAKKKGLELVENLAPDLPKIKFDRSLITQVITNLLGNAIKFSSRGQIVVETQRGEKSITVFVRDQGPGIRSEDRGKLFQQFSQIQSETETPPEASGTGLGLAISRKIVEMHRGKIGVESVWGQGSTFYFTLPIVERRTRWENQTKESNT